MTVLLTIFGISLFGIVWMLIIELYEMRAEKRALLPRWLVQREGSVRAWAVRESGRLVRRCTTAGVYCSVKARSGARTCVMWCRERMRRKRQTQAPVLEKNGGASMFIKGVVEHKHRARDEYINGRE